MPERKKYMLPEVSFWYIIYLRDKCMLSSNILSKGADYYESGN